MKNPHSSLLILICIFLLSSCSKEEEEVLPCASSENISMKINGEFMEFQIMGWGIDWDRPDGGHTLFLMIASGTFSPQQDSYYITLKLPYKQTGENIIEKFNYVRNENAPSVEGDFVHGNLQSKVTVNTRNCFRATFSGSAIIDGKEIIITEGIFDHVYVDPFENYD